MARRDHKSLTMNDPSLVAQIKKYQNITRVKGPRTLYLYSFIIGIISGFFALGFSYALSLAESFTFGYLAHIDLGFDSGHIGMQDNFKPVIFFFVPIVGLFLSGLVVQLFDKQSGGAGTDAMIHAFHEKEGRIEKRTPIVKSIATICTLAGAGSAGKEGPMAQIGSSLGSIMARFLGVGPRAARSLFIAGAAGALGAIFRAPLGAAITAVEVLYQEDFESDCLIPSIIASISGYFIFTSFKDFDTLFHIGEIGFSNWRELFFYVVLGFICYPIGYAYVKIYEIISRFFSDLDLPICVKALFGGCLISLIGLISWESIGSGFGFLQQIMNDDYSSSNSNLRYFLSPEQGAWSLFLYLFVIIFLKIFATSFTIGSGASGGVFGPSIFIGGILGAAVGNISHYFFPDIVISPTPYIVVGMAGFFAGVANAPIGSIIMVCELTGSYKLLAPLLIVAVLSIILSSNISIYKGQKLNKFRSPAHLWDIWKEQNPKEKARKS